MTSIQVLVVVGCVIILATILLPILASSRRHTNRIYCVSNLKQINLAFRIWEGDHSNQYPMAAARNSSLQEMSPAALN